MNASAKKHISILLVDDVMAVRRGLSTILQLIDDLIIVGEAQNGLEAIRLAEQLKPDVILMDLAMPELDGFEATRRIKADHPEIRVCALSIYDDAKTQEKAYAASADAFIDKEADTQLLISTIRELTKRTMKVN